MSSSAKLPDPETYELLLESIAALDDAVFFLEALGKDEKWVIWNDGGAPFGKPEFKGPGHYTAKEFIAYASHLKGRLLAVQESFQKRKEASRRQRRARRQRQSK